MRQVLSPGALGRPRGIGWRGRWEGGSGWGIHVNPLLIHVHVWQKPLQYCKVISLQLIKINGKKKLSTKKKKKRTFCPRAQRPQTIWKQDGECGLLLTSTSTHQKKVLELIKPPLNHYYKTSPGGVGTDSLEGLSSLWPPLPGKAMKLFFSTSPKTLSQRFNSGTDLL